MRDFFLPSIKGQYRTYYAPGVLKCLRGRCDSRSESEPICKLSVIGGDEGVAESARDAADEVDFDLAASSARFTSIACLWAERAGAAEFEASRSFPDAVSDRFGREADEVASAVIADSRVHLVGLDFPFSSMSECGN